MTAPVRPPRREDLPPEIGRYIEALARAQEEKDFLERTGPYAPLQAEATETP